MIDCSHGNSEKDHRRQKDVAASICEQVAAGSWQVFGAMLESHLVEGRQDYVPGQPSVYGQSITDAVPVAGPDGAAPRAAGRRAAEARHRALTRSALTRGMADGRTVGLSGRFSSTRLPYIYHLPPSIQNPTPFVFVLTRIRYMSAVM